MSAPSDAAARHRLFRAMVLMGGSMALGCGGVTKSDREVSSNGGVSGSGGSGGSATSATGGSAGAGGAIIAAAGAGAQPPVELGPLPCPSPQYVCSDVYCGDRGNGWTLGSDCRCDAGRPASAADCQRGETFVCRMGTWTADGRQLTEVVPFDCWCVPAADYCGTACDEAFADNGYSNLSCEQPSDGGVLCGCAVIVLK